MIDSIQLQYNNFADLPNLSYNIITYLLENDDTIWKLLYYEDPGAWSKPALTKQQKGLLVYDGIKPETSCRVFMDLGQDQAWKEKAAILRIAVADIDPTNITYATMSVILQVYCHYQMNTLSNYTNRTITITQRLLQVLNGAAVTGLGRLYFDKRASPNCKTTVIGAIPFKGYQTLMCNRIAGA
jgi:hypothetical protein